ncbi:uncharacterized protein [Haliotis asinina]|uniref:uncharacterized protein n=1 Tax=Haliotis asinina TaxID=109174 RepID=UPI0035325B90
MPCWDECQSCLGTVKCGMCLLVTFAYLCCCPCFCPRAMRFGGKKTLADRFNKKTRSELFKRVLAWPRNKDNTKTLSMKILVIGPERSGKSAFIRSLESIFQGKIIPHGVDGQCHEKTLTHKGKTLPITMLECHEISEDGSVYDQVVKTIEAQIPLTENVSTHTISVLTEEVCPDTMLGAVFVFDAQNITELTQSDRVAQYDKINNLLQQNHIPRSVVMTHVDALTPDIPTHFWPSSVRGALSLGEALFHVHVSFPVKCYTDQTKLEQKTDILLLDALNSILYLCFIRPRLLSKGQGTKLTVNMARRLSAKLSRNPDWREHPPFTEKTRDELLQYVTSWKPTERVQEAFGRKPLRLLVLGPAGHGKSSFVSSIKSCVGREIGQGAVVGAGLSQVSRQYNEHTLICNDKDLPFVLCDSRGLYEEGEGAGINGIMKIITGQFQQGEIMPTQNDSMVEEDGDGGRGVQPFKTTDLPLGIILVVNAEKTEILGNKLSFREYLEKIMEALNDMEIPRCVVMTHADVIVQSDLKTAFSNKLLEQAVKSAGYLFHVPKHNVFPVKCYTDETVLKKKVDILLLDALKYALIAARHRAEFVAS